MLNFALGPVTSPEDVCAVGGEQVPYFRTAEFSQIMLENERLACRFAKAPVNARAVFLTASGTGAMEAAVMNAFTPDDKVLIVIGGGFGQRFAEICDVHGIPHEDIRLETGHPLTEEHLAAFENQGFIKQIEDDDEAVDFSCGGAGVGSGTSYVGFYYTPDNDMTAVWCAPSSSLMLVPCGDGYEWWEPNGDNHYYTEHICGNFYYYEASF